MSDPRLGDSEEFLPFALPDIGPREIGAVVQALESKWLSSGPLVRRFELEFASRFCDGTEAIAVNSATAGLHLALEAIGIQPGDEVLVPTWTFTATAEVVRYLGAEPILVDVDQHSLTIDWADAERRLSPRTTAVIPVHFAGLPMDPKATAAFASRNGLAVVEDAAHAFPAARGGLEVGGSESVATVFSFYATKTMTTGEGGMVVTRDAKLANRVRTMRLHGISRDAFSRYRSRIPAWRYEVIAPGFKYNMTDPSAALGLVQLERAEEMRARRQAIAARYLEAFRSTDLVMPPTGDEGTRHAWHLFVVRLPDRLKRDVFIDELALKGVGSSVHFIPLHLQPYWRDRRSEPANAYPVATAVFEDVVSLPIFSAMSESDIEKVITSVDALVTR